MVIGEEKSFVYPLSPGGTDTSDATATASDILDGKTAYANGVKLEGNIPNKTSEDVSVSDNVVIVPKGNYASGFNVTVGFEKTAQTYTPTTSDQTIAAGNFLTGDQTIKGDANLIPANIADGVTIFDITGTHGGGGGTKPSYLISDGDTVSTLYFNKDYNLNTFLAGLTYDSQDTTYGFYYAYLALGWLIAIDLSTISGAGLTGYVLFWAKPSEPAVLYSTTTFDLSSIITGLVVTTAGWQVGYFTPASAVTMDVMTSNASFVSIMDNVVAQDDIAFGDHGSSKAHTFAIPTITGTYTYTGSSQTPTITGFYADFMTKSGNTSATSAGSYSITVSLSDTTNCQWSDGTTAAKTVAWSIAKAALPKPTLSAGAITLNDSTTSGTFTVTRSGNGAITATSSNPTKISASVSGTTVTVTALDTSAEATANITITVAEGTNYLAYTATDVKCVVSIVLAARNTLYITTAAANVSPTFCITVTGGDLTIDYGDGNSETVTGTTISARVKNHTYANAGNYAVKFYPATGVTWSPGANYKPTGASVAANYSILNTGISTTLISNLSASKFLGVEGIETIPPSAFHKITTITEIVIPNGVTTIGSSAFSNTAITYMNIPDTVTTIPSTNMLYNYPTLTAIKIGNGVSTLGRRTCASNANLTTVELGTGITNIGSQVFENDTSLSSFTIHATTPPTIDSTAFDGCPANFAIYVPASSVSAYQAAQYWSNRAAYIQAIPTT